MLAAFNNIDKKEHNHIIETYKNWLKEIANELNTQLSVEEQKQAKASFYSMVYSST